MSLVREALEVLFIILSFENNYNHYLGTVFIRISAQSRISAHLE